MKKDCGNGALLYFYRAGGTFKTAESRSNHEINIKVKWHTSVWNVQSFRQWINIYIYASVCIYIYMYIT
jgi:hypothetical protein